MEEEREARKLRNRGRGFVKWSQRLVRMSWVKRLSNHHSRRAEKKYEKRLPREHTKTKVKIQREREDKYEEKI